HHHMLYVTERINGGILWANLALLFFLSLVPVSTAWLGNTHGALWPTVVYGVTLLLPGCAYYVLQNLIVREQGADSLIAKAIGDDWKGNLSPILYVVGIGLAFVSPLIAQALYVLVALMWLVPDPRIERAISRKS